MSERTGTSPATEAREPRVGAATSATGPWRGVVVEHARLSAHLVRLVLAGPGLAGLPGSGVPDEWVPLTVPGQFQTRYYTVRSWDGERLFLDVVLHDEGLVTSWARAECLGDEVGVGAPRGAFALPQDAGWVLLVGDLTALPALARITEHLALSRPDLPVRTVVEAPDEPVADYDLDAQWVVPPAAGSDLAGLVASLEWPEGPGYFWMAGESAQMREIRRHVRREVGLDTRHHDVMGYWSRTRGQRTREVDPGPIVARGRALGHSDEQIWAAYDDARSEADQR